MDNEETAVAYRKILFQYLPGYALRMLGLVAEIETYALGSTQQNLCRLL
jgi:hypothetical protein